MNQPVKVLSTTFLAALMLLALLARPATAAPERLQRLDLNPKLSRQVADQVTPKLAPELELKPSGAAIRDVDLGHHQLPDLTKVPTTPALGAGPKLVSLDVHYMWQSSVDARGRGIHGGCDSPTRLDRQVFLTLMEGRQTDWDRATWRGRVNVDGVSSRAQLALPAGRTSAFGVLEAIDNDSFGCGGADDRLDINPDAGDTNLDLPIRIDLVTGKVWQTSRFPYGEDVRELGGLNTEITSRGNDESTDRGGIRFSARVSTLAEAPTQIRVDEVRAGSADPRDVGVFIETWDGGATRSDHTDGARQTKLTQPVQDWSGLRSAALEGQRNPGWISARPTPAGRIVTGRISLGPAGSVKIRANMATGAVDEVLNGNNPDRATFRRLGMVGTPITVNTGPANTGMTFTVLGPVTEPAAADTTRTSTFTVERVEWLRGSDPGDADFKAEIRMSDRSTERRPLKTGHVQDDNDITPGWTQTLRTRTNVPFNVDMTLKDDNTFSDDIYDIVPSGAHKDLNLTVTGDRIVLNGSHIGNVGESITTQGGAFENYRARVTFRIDHSNVEPIAAPAESTMVEIRSLKRTGRPELPASGPSADHKATITLEHFVNPTNRSVFASSHIEDALEISPGWATSILTPSKAVKVSIQIEDDNIARDTQVDVTPTAGNKLEVTVTPDGFILGPNGAVGRVGTPFTTTGTSAINAEMTVLIRQA